MRLVTASELFLILLVGLFVLGANKTRLSRADPFYFRLGCAVAFLVTVQTATVVTNALKGAPMTAGLPIAVVGTSITLVWVTVAWVLRMRNARHR